MYIAKIYSKKYQTAFVVLGHCKNADMVILEIDLFQLQTGIKLPAQITTADIAKYQSLLQVDVPETKSAPAFTKEENTAIIKSLQQ